MISLEHITNFFRGRLTLGEPLAKYTSFRIGGPADFYIEPADRDDLLDLIQYLGRENIPFVVLGCGSNVLVSDEGLRGVVINLEHGLNRIHIDDGIVNAEAGVRMGKFVDFCIQHGFGGVEMLAGIPGTIGGGVVMNAGAYGGEIANHFVSVEIIRDGKVVELKKEECGFAYRRSNFSRDIVLKARFRFSLGDKAEMIKQRRELLLRRNLSQPLNLPNSGSVFKNPAGQYAAKLIEECGLKGTRRGKAQISEKHGNFIVNHGGATAMNVIELIELARRTVRDKFGVTLEPEVKLLGFSEEVYQGVYS